MKYKIKSRTVFWSVFVFLTVLNIIPILITRKKLEMSASAFTGILLFLLVVIHGVLACVEKNENILFVFLRRTRKKSRFYKYNRPTKEQLNAFYIRATVYFAAIPFYIPIIFFSTTLLHAAWYLLPLLVPQLILIGIDVRKTLREVKEAKSKEKLLENEKRDQERREELGRWK